MSVIKTFSSNVFQIRSSLEALAAFTNNNARRLQQFPYKGTDINKVFENGKYKSTTIALGSSPAVQSKPLLSAPTITSAEIALDGLNNPYVIINFNIDRETLAQNKIVSFKIYRQSLPAEDLAQEVENFTGADFDKISTLSLSAGKFSADKKAAYTIDQFKQSQVNKNTNIFVSQQTRNAQKTGDVINSDASGYPDYFSQPLPKIPGPNALIATMDFKKTLQEAQNKQVYTIDKSGYNLSYSDKTVVYGSGYQYTLTSFCETSEESTPSPSVSMVVLNLNPISKPSSVTIKQISETEAILNAILNSGDLVKYVYIYRRNVDDLFFHPLDVVENNNNSISYRDSTVGYLKSYIYRLICENVFGVVSEPVELNLVCSTQKTIAKTRSNNLRLPIVIASQDQNSDGVKVSIFPNDSRVLYYLLERQNLTLNEKSFSVPQNKLKQFWENNQFFVPQSASLSSSLGQITSGSLPAQSQFVNLAKPIEFIDHVLIPGHVYRYRVSGHDLYENKTGYGFDTITARNKNVLRSPVNFHYEILRDSPFRTKLTWDNDNEASLQDEAHAAQQRYLQIALQQIKLSQQQQDYISSTVAGQELSTVDLNALLAPYNVTQAQLTAIQTELAGLAIAKNIVKYQLQRRLNGDVNYVSFPLTENNFVIDETPAADAIPFTPYLVSASIGPSSSSIVDSNVSFSRSFGLPNFMQAQQVYQFRVCATTLDGQTSDFTSPITVVASSKIAEPSEFSASILNENVKPAVVRLSWNYDKTQQRPDRWQIERKVNIATDAFRVIGYSYIDNIFFDRTAELGQQYLYRLRSLSVAGDESDIKTASVTT